MASCPHHTDRQASLSIKEGEDGRVLLHCFAGCANADVVASAGLSFPDLFPPGSRERMKARVFVGSIAMNPNGRPALTAFGDDQVAALLGELARLAKVRGTLDKPVALRQGPGCGRWRQPRAAHRGGAALAEEAE